VKVPSAQKLPTTTSSAVNGGTGATAAAAPSAFKVLIMGDPEVGKTALVNQFANCDIAAVLGRGDSSWFCLMCFKHKY